MTVALLLEPQDLLFARDGRPIVPGEGAAAGTSVPSPQVVAGAIRSAVLKARGHLRTAGPVAAAHLDAIQSVRIRGPLLWDDATQRPVLPAPADCVAAEKPKHGQGRGGVLRRLLPLADGITLPGWSAPDGLPRLRPLWCDSPAALKPGNPDQAARQRAWHAQPGYLTWAGWTAWAAGQAPAPGEHRQPDDLWVVETRTQVGLSVTQGTAEDGRLFSTRYLRLRPGIRLYVEVDGADVELAQPSTLLLAGDRRLARTTPVPAIHWPTATGPRRTAMAITPCILPGANATVPADWSSTCCGVAIAGADPISGWDLAAQGGAGAPRPTRFAIRAGAVWHLDGLSAPPTSVGIHIDQGFGWLAWGTWNPALSS